jgi:predicted MFS family arabinose efflux permease
MSRSLTAPQHRVMGLPAVFLVAATAGVAQSFGRFAFGVVLPAVRSDLDLSNTVAGSLATVNVGAYLFGTLVVASVANRYKLLRIMRTGFVFSLLGLVLAAIAPNVLVVGLAMFASGFGGALIWIPAPVVAAAAMPPEKRSLAIGLLGTGMGAGVVFASQLSSYIRSSSGDESWRSVYVVLAVIAFIVLAATFVFVGHEQDQPTGSKGGFGGFAALKRMQGWKALTAAYTSFGFMYLLILAFLSTKLEEDNGWTSSRASLAFTLVGVAMMFGGPVFITLASRIGSRIGLAVAFSGWVFVVLLILPGWFAVTLPASVAVGLLFAGIPSMITLYVVRNTTVEDYGPSFAAATLAFGVAQMISPQAGGILADVTGSFTIVFILSAALAVTGLVAALQLPPRGE